MTKKFHCGVALAVTGAFVWLQALAQLQTDVPAVVPGAKPVTVEHIKVHGTALEGNLEGDAVDRDVIVFLPPGYGKDSSRRYPVVYALHGFYIGAEQWTHEIHVPQTIEGAFAKGTPEMIVVLPDSKTAHNGSMYSSSVTTGDFERFVAHDLVEYIDAHYRTIPDRLSRGLAGHSMGGYGTARIGMKHPQVFGSLYAMSPCCLSAREPGPNSVELEKAVAAMKVPSDSAVLQFFPRAQLASAAAWSPDPHNPPLYLDLPTKDGKVQPDVLAKWAANAPLAALDQYIGNLHRYRAIALDVGDQDGLREDTAKLHEALDKYGIANTFEVYRGTHTSAVADRFQNHVLPFFGRTLVTGSPQEAAGGVVTGEGSAAVASLPFRNSSLPINTRVDDLVSRMTLEEKVSQMMHAAAAVPRLGIPAFNWWSEGLHGVAATGIATVFPQSIAMAASFDPDLLHTEAGVIATEFRAKYNEELRTLGYSRWFHGLTVWSPNINIFRDPRWGRGQETYGEDPFLTAQMGVAFVTGLQGNDPKYWQVVSTPKHFAVHSGPESTRHSVDVQISRHDLEDTYLPAFRATVLAGAGSVMCAYNRVDGKPACAQPLLLQEHLRDAWDFDGYVVSDCGAASDIFRNHHYAATMPQGMAAAVKAGMDLICTWPEQAVKEESAALLAAVHEGLLSESDIDRSVRRLFAARMRLGMFDPPSAVPAAAIPMSENDTEAHRELALRAARETLVLLKNKGRLLPLTRQYENIAVIGPNADNVSALVGNYNGTPSRPITILAGVRKRFSSSNVIYAQGSSLIGPPLVPVPAAALKTDSGAQGLTGEYFRGRDLQGSSVITRTDASVNFEWREGAAAELKADFSARWTGTLSPSATGEYEVGLTATGPFKIWVDNQLIGQIPPGGNARTLTKTLHLQAGLSYPVRIEYGQTGGIGTTKLVWRPPGSGKDYVAALQKADLVIAVLGLSNELEGEEMPLSIPGFKGGDRTSLELPKAQQELLADLVASGKPVILVLTNGSALAVDWADKHVPAILEAWYPGEEGGTAVAEALAGDFSPSGKLPVTIYKSVDQLPPFESYDMQGRTYRYFTGEPLYAFGYGLSYTTFAFSNLKFNHTELGASDDLTATVDVKNTGKMPGDAVLQTYLSRPGVAGAPLRSLAGFQRVTLQAGESRPVTVHIPNRNLSIVTPDGTRKLVPGDLQVWVGEGQPATRAGLVKPTGVAGSVRIAAAATLPN
jgi:beta-glucosidase